MGGSYEGFLSGVHNNEITILYWDMGAPLFCDIPQKKLDDRQSCYMHIF